MKPVGKMGFIALCILLLFQGAFAACPYGCVCDDENLNVNCFEANLDVVPITLNPSVQKLNLRSNRIKSVETGFSFYQQLTYLDLSHNHLVKIQPGSFLSQQKLVQLNLEHNKLSELSNRTFLNQMRALVILNLRDNLLDTIETGLFASMASLEELDLSKNSIKNLNKSVFTGLSNLRILKVDNNELTRVPETFETRGSFGSSPSTSPVPFLAELSLASNPIVKLQNDAFGNVKNLVTLDLRGCRIATIDPNAFRGLDQLRKLFLSDNSLKRIPTTSFQPLIQVEILRMGKNPVEQIEKYAFNGLKALQILELSGMNELQIVNHESFSMNLDLETIELSNSKKLLALPHLLFRGLSSLKNLNLKENGLTSLPEDLASWQNLRSLYLDGNPFICTCEIIWLRDLFNDLDKFQNASKFVMCDQPRELKGRKISSLTDKDTNCGMNGPFQKIIIGVSIGVTIIFLIIFFVILYRNHDRIKNACKRRGGLFRGSGSNRRKARNAVISSGKELDTKTSFLNHQNPYPFSTGSGLNTDEEFAVRASLMANSPPPNGVFLHHPSNFHPALHSHYHQNNSSNYPSNYNEYDTPIIPQQLQQHHQQHQQQHHYNPGNGTLNHHTLNSHYSHYGPEPQRILENGYHQHHQFPLGVHNPPALPTSKPIPITEL